MFFTFYCTYTIIYQTECIIVFPMKCPRGVSEKKSCMGRAVVSVCGLFGIKTKRNCSASLSSKPPWLGDKDLNTYRNRSSVIKQVKRPCSADHVLRTTCSPKTPQQNQTEDYSTWGHGAVSSSQTQYSQWVCLSASVCLMSRVSDFGGLSDSSSKSQCLTRALRLSIAPRPFFPFSPRVSFMRVFGFLLQSKEAEREKRDNDGEREWKKG